MLLNVLTEATLAVGALLIGLGLQMGATSGSSKILVLETPFNTIATDGRSLLFKHPKGEVEIQSGLSIPQETNLRECNDGQVNCLAFGGTQLVIRDDDHCREISWISTELPELKDCVAIKGHWYGGGEQFSQPWPIEKVARKETPYVIADMLQNSATWYGGVSEAYWVSSLGIAIKVSEDTPLFLSLPDEDGDGDADYLCFRAAKELPFYRDPGIPLKLSYHLCSGDNVREVHERTYPKFFPTPSGGVPDNRMIEDPIWSTWAEFKEKVNDTKVRDLAHQIKRRGFTNSQIAIDDNWEICYGEHVFNPDRFPDPKKLVDDLHEEGFRVTLWIHPFINDDCESFNVADQKGFFIKDSKGVTQKTSWWQGKNNSAGLIDFTNPSAVTWWTQRLQELKDSIGIDAFKFDAGETSYMPKSYVLQEDSSIWPNIFSKRFIEAIAPFGDLIEARVGRGTQNHPMFIRMLDKDSNWSNQNGLKTLVPSLLHFGLLGYPFVLPDMIGGNSYHQQPSPELFLRWAQANTFMPALQFSLWPWNYGEQMSERCKKVTSLHKAMAPLILRLAKEATASGVPMMRPTWWLCPKEEACLVADQQFLLGDELLVSPIVDEFATTLQVVFPPGNWRRADTGHVYKGTGKHTMDNITLDNIVYFIKESKTEL